MAKPGTMSGNSPSTRTPRQTVVSPASSVVIRFPHLRPGFAIRAMHFVGSLIFCGLPKRLIASQWGDLRSAVAAGSETLAGAG